MITENELNDFDWSFNGKMWKLTDEEDSNTLAVIWKEIDRFFGQLKTSNSTESLQGDYDTLEEAKLDLVSEITGD